MLHCQNWNQSESVALAAPCSRSVSVCIFRSFRFSLYLNNVGGPLSAYLFCICEFCVHKKRRHWSLTATERIWVWLCAARCAFTNLLRLWNATQPPQHAHIIALSLKLFAFPLRFVCHAYAQWNRIAISVTIVFHFLLVWFDWLGRRFICKMIHRLKNCTSKFWCAFSGSPRQRVWISFPNRNFKMLINLSFKTFQTSDQTRTNAQHC